LLLKVLVAYVERDDEPGSEAALAALGGVPEPVASEWRARGLLERAQSHLRSGDADAATRDLRKARELVAAITVPQLAMDYWNQGNGPVRRRAMVTFGSIQAAVEIGRAVATGLAEAGHEAEAREALADAEKTADRIAKPDADETFLWTKLAELRVRLAGDWRALGKTEHASELLEGALDAAGRIPFPVEAGATAETSGFDSAASRAVDRVSAFVWAAAGLEAVGDRRAPATLSTALGDLQRIRNEEWRGYGWRYVVAAFSATIGTERAVDVLVTPPVPDPDRYFAVSELEEEILTGPNPERLLPALEAIPASWGKVEAFAKVATRLAGEGRRDQADSLVDEALRAVAQKDEAWSNMLMVLGAQAPDAAAPASPERRALLRRLLVPPSEVEETVDAELVAVVVEVEMLSRYEGVVIPVDFDPRFVLTLRIESASVALEGFEPGVTVAFAIHSPTLLFRGQPEEGTRYRFLVRRTSAADTTTFSRLEILSP